MMILLMTVTILIIINENINDYTDSTTEDTYTNTDHDINDNKVNHDNVCMLT